MKTGTLIFLFFISFSGNNYCQKQRDCDRMFTDAKKCAARGDYENALNKLNAAKICNSQETKYDKAIIEIYNEINLQKKKAEKSQKDAETAKGKLSEANIVLQQNKNDLEIQSIELQKKSDSAKDLKNFALAIKHSEKSIAIPTYDQARNTLKAYLALISYQLFRESGKESNSLQTQIYSSLYDAIKSNISNNNTNHYFNNVTSYQEGADHLAFAAVTRDNNNNSTVFISAENSRLYSFDLKSYKPETHDSLTKGEIFLNLKTSPGGRWTALITLSRNLYIIDSHEGLRSLKNLTGIKGISKFWLDDATLYAYGQDSLFYMMQLKEKTVVKKKLFFKIEELTISNNHIYALATNGIVKWDKKTPAASVFINRPDATVSGTKISCKADDSLIVWGNENGQVYYSKNNSESAQHLASFRGPITDIAFNRAGNLVAVASFDKSIRIFNLLNLEGDVPLVLNANEGPVTSVFFEKDAKGREMLIAVISPGLIRVYPMDLESLACNIYSFYIDMPKQTIDLDKYVDKAVEKRNVQSPCK